MKVAKSIIAAGLLLIACLCLLSGTEITDFPRIVTFYSVAFLGYFLIISEKSNLWAWLLLGLMIRIVAIFSFPSLSDDIYRFIWDGWLINEGINPFSSTPSEININLSGFHTFLLEKMNSPDYYSVYPTILQAIFSFTVWCIPTGLLMQSILMKSILLIVEIIAVVFSIRLLNSLNLDKRKILIYYINPLVIIELMGNLHMELVMIAGFAVFLWAWQEKKYLLAASGLSFSVGAKLITILVSPFLLKRVKLKKRIFFGLSFSLLLIFLFAPLFLSSYENFGKGLDLYFQKFEFNASIYYLIRTLGYWFKGYNIIGFLGPILAIISAFLILFLAWKEKELSIQSLCSYLTIGLSCYYFLGTTVHPWYTSLLVFLAVFSNLKYPIIWSFLAVFSYAKYYQEAEYYMLAVAIEYGILFLIILLEYRGFIDRFLQSTFKIKQEV